MAYSKDMLIYHTGGNTITVWHTVNDVVIKVAWEVTDRALEGSDDIRTTEEGDTRQTEIEL